MDLRSCARACLLARDLYFASGGELLKDGVELCELCFELFAARNYLAHLSVQSKSLLYVLLTLLNLGEPVVQDTHRCR